MALSVLLTFWPPAPEARKVSMRRSSGGMESSVSPTSGSTATVAVLVWMRPLLSVTGTRLTQCAPASKRSRRQASSPRTSQTSSRRPPSSVSLTDSSRVCQPRRAA